MDSVHHFCRAVAGLGKLFGLDPPDAGNVSASGGVRERSLPWKLVALLPMLTAALAVSLAGNHRGTRTLAPNISSSQSNVEHGQAIFHALGLMLESTSVHHNGALRFADPTRGLLDGLRRHPRHFTYFAQIPLLGRFGDRLKTSGVLVD